MAARVEVKTWAAAVAVLHRVRPRKAYQDILLCVRVENGAPGTLHLSATDLEVGAIVTVPCAGKLSAPILMRELPAKPRGFVELDGDAESYTVKTADGAGQYIQGGAADDFPAVGADAKPWGTWAPAPFLAALRHALKAAAREARHYAINSVCLDGRTGPAKANDVSEPGATGLTIVSTDARRLHWTAGLDAPDRAASVLMPLAAAAVLTRFASKADSLAFGLEERAQTRTEEIEEVRSAQAKAQDYSYHEGRTPEKVIEDRREEPSYTPSRVAVGVTDWRAGALAVRLVWRVVEGNFPKWREAIPDESETAARAILDAQDFTRTVRAGASYTSAETRGTTIRAVKGRLVVSGRAPERGEGHAWGGLVEGDIRPMMANPAFLAEAVNGAPKIKLLTHGETRPMVIYSGVHGAVVMPIQLRDGGGSLHAPPEGDPPPLVQEPERPRRRKVARAQSRKVEIEGATFAEKVRNGRKAAGLSLKALAALFDRDTSTVWRWEKAKLAPDKLTQAGALAILAEKLSQGEGRR